MRESAHRYTWDVLKQYGKLVRISSFKCVCIYHTFETKIKSRMQLTREPMWPTTKVTCTNTRKFYTLEI